MVVFLANRVNLQTKRLHDRIKNRLGGEFDDLRRRRSEPREPGRYRVVAELDPHRYLEADYPARDARIEIGFRLKTGEPYEYYWFNWIEPDRSMMVGWHQDDTHDDLGPVHLQVNDGATPVTRKPAEFIDTHPLDVVQRRLRSLIGVVTSVEWKQDRPVGLGSGDPEVE
ncbi:MAG: hypothetical protein ABEK59_02890 [Halobacteria archaeon]